MRSNRSARAAVVSACLTGVVCLTLAMRSPRVAQLRTVDVLSLVAGGAALGAGITRAVSLRRGDPTL